MATTRSRCLCHADRRRAFDQGAQHVAAGDNTHQAAILHDRISDAIIAWSGEEADAFRRSCVEREDGTLAWNGYEFDGWGNVLGG